MLIAKGRGATLTIEVRDFDGVLAAPTGNVVVTVKDIDDSTVSTGNASATGTTGKYAYTLPLAVVGTLGRYEVTAAYTLAGVQSTRSYRIEVVGDYLFEINELRDRNSAISAAAFPADLVREARQMATEAMERSAQVAFSKRSKRAVLNGDGTSTLVLPDVEVSEILGVTIYGEDYGTDLGDDITGAELADVEVNRETGVLTRTDGRLFPHGSNNIVVDYEHGYDQVPGPIRDAAMTLVLEYLVPSGLPARATSQATDIGDFRISVANVDYGRDTGIPAVDAAIALFGRRRPRLG